MSKPMPFYVILSNFGGTLAIEGCETLQEAKLKIRDMAFDLESGDNIRIEETEELDTNDFNYVGSPDHY